MGERQVAHNNVNNIEKGEDLWLVDLRDINPNGILRRANASITPWNRKAEEGFDLFDRVAYTPITEAEA